MELLSLLTDVLSVTADGGEVLIDELELVLQSRGDQSQPTDEYWLSMPTTEIDFSQCRRCTPSYRKFWTLNTCVFLNTNHVDF